MPAVFATSTAGPESPVRRQCARHGRARAKRGLRLAIGVVLCAAGLASGCHHKTARVVRNPYAHVSWKTDQAFKAQLHEHVRDNPVLLKKMDDAGYDIVPLMHYSGVASRSYPWRERHWPPERFLPPGFASEMKHIKLFFPNAEEVGRHHILSPFLTTYIAKWEPKYYPRREPWHYASNQEAIDRIVKYGGLAFIAHPWKNPKEYVQLHGFTGMELYNAYCRAKFQSGKLKTDQNVNLLKSWDRVLYDKPSVVGIAVNDWYGPATSDTHVTPDTKDSGKIIVLMKRATLEDFRAALTAGVVFAVKDLGVFKDHFPRVTSIEVRGPAIRIQARGAHEVRWIADGKTLPHHHGYTLRLASVAPDTHYVRAELVGRDGSTTYTQAFALAWK